MVGGGEGAGAAPGVHGKFLGGIVRLTRATHCPEVTRKQMAQRASLQPDSISGIETGSKWPSSKVLAAYEAACGLAPGALTQILAHLREAEPAQRPAAGTLAGWERACRAPFGAFALLADELYAPSPPSRTRPRPSRARTAVAVAGAVGVVAAVAWLVLRGGDAPDARITSPEAGTTVCYEQPVGGRSSGLGGDDLWLVVRPLPGALLYPQPEPVAPGERWTGVAYFGGSRDGAIGHSFELRVVRASPAAHRALAAYIQGGSYSGFTSLPPGTESLHVVTVVRGDC